jgi:mannose-P-dolichol utilization defect protein 1
MEATLKVPRVLLNLSDKLVGPSCTSQLFESFQIWPLSTKDPACTKLLLRKSLNLGIVSGSALVKLPQILKVLLNQSAKGLSLFGQVLELTASTLGGVYNFRKGNSFMVYGETVFVSIQNALLVLLIGFYGNKMMLLLLITAMYSVLLSTLLIPNYVTIDQLTILQAVTIPISALARLPQIYQVWSTQSAGQLSSISLFLTMAGSIARLYTSTSEVKDPILLVGYSSTALLNTILFVQVIFTSKKRVAKKAVSKKKRE